MYSLSVWFWYYPEHHSLTVHSTPYLQCTIKCFRFIQYCCRWFWTPCLHYLLFGIFNFIFLFCLTFTDVDNYTRSWFCSCMKFILLPWKAANKDRTKNIPSNTKPLYLRKSLRAAVYNQILIYSHLNFNLLKFHNSPDLFHVLKIAPVSVTLFSEIQSFNWSSKGRREM